MRILIVTLCLIAAAVSAPASTLIEGDRVRSSGGGFSHGAVDPETGSYYEFSTFASGQPFRTYDSLAAFRAGSPSTLASLQNGGPFGSYTTVRNGVLTGRTDTSSPRMSNWSLTTGAITQTANYTGICGSNSFCTFDWGGFSGLATFQDQTGAYLLGTNGLDWLLYELAGDLTLRLVKSFQRTAANNGYGFMIDGTLFLGSSFNSPDIRFAYDTRRDSVYDPEVLLQSEGLSTSLYRNGMFYDPLSDALFYHERNSSAWFAVDDAAAAFGVAPIPLPGAGLLLAAGLPALLMLRRGTGAAPDGP